MRTARFMFGREFAIFKYLVAVTDHLAAFMFFLGIAFSYFARKSGNKLLSRIIYLAAILGIISGFVIFGIRMHNPKGMNLPLLAFNRKLIIFIAGAAIVSSALALLNLIRAFVFKKDNFLSKIFCYTQLFVAVILVTSSLMYLIPPVIQFTREFVYFGEAGISTNAMLRALGFVIGIFVCLLLLLSSYKVHRSLETEIQKITFLFLSACAFALEFSAASISALQRLKLIPLTDNIFKIMIWRGENPNAFLYLQLALGVLMFAFVIITHTKPRGDFANKALLRKEKARLRDCRRWSWSLCVFGAIVVFIVVVVHYYDTKPPAEIQPESYEISENIISIPLSQVSDGHLHKFSYVTPNNFDVRFLIVKKPTGTAYGVGLDACEICGIAGYYERGNEEVVCRRCDVVMNKNTIGFKGGCNPIPFDYEVRNAKIYIDVKNLIEHERRFK